MYSAANPNINHSMLVKSHSKVGAVCTAFTMSRSLGCVVLQEKDSDAPARYQYYSITIINLHHYNVNVVSTTHHHHTPPITKLTLIV